MFEARDHMPYLELFPALTPDEVERFVALGETGWDRYRNGDEAGAVRAFREQVGIYAPNPEPHVSLALAAAGRGDRERALAHLQDAVARGFSDLPRLERAEVWNDLDAHPRFLAMQDAAASILEFEGRWAGWDLFSTARAPADVGTVIRDRTVRNTILDAMAPALGERNTALWHRIVDRSSAARLEAYVAGRPDAEDIGTALDSLMDLYAGPHVLNRWGRVPQAVAGRLEAVAETALAREPEGVQNPGALICRALAATADRDRKGRLTAGAAETIQASLTAILETDVDGPVAATAIDGLVRTAYETGHEELARTAFRNFVADRSGDPTLIDDVRVRLGALGLRAGGLPEFVATALDGTAVSDKGLRGKVVVVDFWATWCGPCVEQIPDLRRIAERHGPDVTMIGVSLDDADMMSSSALRAWVEREGVPGSQLYDGQGWDSRLVRAFGVRQIPFSVVVAADGTVVAVDPSRRKLSKAVRSAIASKDQVAGI